MVTTLLRACHKTRYNNLLQLSCHRSSQARLLEFNSGSALRRGKATLAPTLQHSPTPLFWLPARLTVQQAGALYFCPHRRCCLLCPYAWGIWPSLFSTQEFCRTLATTSEIQWLSSTAHSGSLSTQKPVSYALTETYIGQQHEHMLDLVLNNDTLVVKHQEQRLSKWSQAGLLC